MRHHWAIASLSLFLGAAPVAQAKSCKEYAEYRSGYTFDNEVCYCGSELSNLTVTLPSSLKIEAVCGLRYQYPETHWIDLKTEKVTLDTYTENGDYLTGFVILSGTMKETTAGTVRVEEGPAGSLWFDAKPNRESPVFSEYHLKELDLGTDEHYKKLRAPRPETMNGNCREAQATIRIRNPIVLLGDTDEAGTGADFDVLHVSKYKPCER